MSCENCLNLQSQLVEAQEQVRELTQNVAAQIAIRAIGDYCQKTNRRFGVELQDAITAAFLAARKETHETS